MKGYIKIFYVINMKRLIGKKSGDVAIIVNEYTIILNGKKFHYTKENGVIRLHNVEFFE